MAPCGNKVLIHNVSHHFTNNPHRTRRSQIQLLGFNLRPLHSVWLSYKRAPFKCGLQNEELWNTHGPNNFTVIWHDMWETVLSTSSENRLISIASLTRETTWQPQRRHMRGNTSNFTGLSIVCELFEHTIEKISMHKVPRYLMRSRQQFLMPVISFWPAKMNS